MTTIQRRVGGQTASTRRERERARERERESSLLARTSLQFSGSSASNEPQEVMLFDGRVCPPCDRSSSAVPGTARGILHDCCSYHGYCPICGRTTRGDDRARRRISGVHRRPPLPPHRGTQNNPSAVRPRYCATGTNVTTAPNEWSVLLLFCARDGEGGALHCRQVGSLPPSVLFAAANERSLIKNVRRGFLVRVVATFSSTDNGLDPVSSRDG
jgi:hypothetical protein